MPQRSWSPTISFAYRSRRSIRCDASRKLFVMLWAAVAKFCSISRMKVSAAFSRASCLRLGRICGISPRNRSPRDAACPPRRRNFAKPAAEVPRHRRVQLRRSRRRAGLDASGRRRVLRGRPLGARAKSVWATHYAPVADLFSRNAPGTAWKSKPTWYIVANNDRTVQPDLQRFLARRMGATTYAVDSSRVPMLSNPSLIIDVIRTAAKAVKVAKGSAAE